jgi:hypothetical protein
MRMKYVLVALLLLLSPLSVATAQTSGLVAHYTFDDGTGIDSSGNGNDATLVNGPMSTTRDTNAALSFDGGNDHLNLGAATSLNITGALTLSVWVKPNNVAGPAQVLVSKESYRSAASAQQWVLALNTFGGEKDFNFEVSNGTKILGKVSVGDAAVTGEWTHVAGTYNGSDQVCLYINGVSIGCTTSPEFGTLRSGPSNPKIATNSWFTQQYYTGALDDVRIYSRALSAAEISEVYTSTMSINTEPPIDPPTTYPPPPTADGPVSGEHFYISQSGTGDGSSCANAKSAAWFSAATNWAVAFQKIGVGDTVHLCGIISSNLIVQGSGSAGSPITVLFEPGAKMESPTWYGGAISITGKSHVIVDGGSGGVIKATRSGSGFGNTAGSVGVVISNSSNVEVKNLTILGMYVRTDTGENCNNACGAGVSIANTFSYISVHHTTITDARVGISISYGPNAHTLSLYSNKISRTAWGIGGGDWPPNGSTLTNVDIYDNTITDAYPWDGTFTGCTGDCWFHLNGIYIWAEQTGDTLSNIRVHGNRIGGNMGTPSHITSFTWFSGNVQAPVLVYDNIYYSTSAGGSASNGFVSFRGCKGVTAEKACGIYNNTFYSQNPAGIGVRAGNGTDIKNNIFYNIAGHVIYAGDTGESLAITSDDNFFWGLKTNQFKLNGGYYTPVKWQALGFDTRSLFELDPLFVNPAALNFSLLPGSPAQGKGAGTYGSSNPLAPLPSTGVIGDFNKDGVVNSLDLSLMSGAWNTSNVVYDLNKDGTVNTLDYSIMVRKWTT